MATSLSPTLLESQRSDSRRPYVLVSASARRFGFPTLEWSRLWLDHSANSPAAACIAGDGALIRLRNVAGDVQIQKIADPTAAAAAWTTWTASFATATSGSQPAIAASGSDVTVIYRRSNTVYHRTSSDYGATFAAETAIVTEASAPSHLAIAIRASTGNACAFWTLSGTTVRRCRRTSGTWAASSTAWTNSAASVTGLAAVHDGANFALVVTGTETTTTHKRVWATRFGDGGIPSNTWAALTAVQEADTASDTAFKAPSLAYLSTYGYYATWTASEAGDVAYDRVFWSHTAASASPNSTWTEPAPHHGADGSDYGLPLAVSTAAGYAASSREVWRCAFPDAEVLTSRLLSARVHFSPQSTSATLELDDQDGSLTAAAQGIISGINSTALAPGHELTIAPAT